MSCESPVPGLRLRLLRCAAAAAAGPLALWELPRGVLPRDYWVFVGILLVYCWYIVGTTLQSVPSVPDAKKIVEGGLSRYIRHFQ